MVDVILQPVADATTLLIAVPSGFTQTSHSHFFLCLLSSIATPFILSPSLFNFLTEVLGEVVVESMLNFVFLLVVPRYIAEVPVVPIQP